MNRPEKQSWAGWYIAVLATLIVQIVLYYWFTQYWS